MYPVAPDVPNLHIRYYWCPEDGMVAHLARGHRWEALILTEDGLLKKFQPQGRLATAALTLWSTLANGPRPAREIMESLQLPRGSLPTVRKMVGVQVSRQGGWSKYGHWVWSLSGPSKV
jgi:hypothetical protein